MTEEIIVNNIHVIEHKDNEYKLQLNTETYILTLDQLRAISNALQLPKGMGLSIG